MRVGIHVQGFKDGAPVGPENAAERGADAIQIFASNPRQWASPEPDPDADSRFVAEMSRLGLEPLIIHAPYLINLSSPTAKTRHLSVRLLSWTLERAARLQAAGVVVHAGSSVGQPRLPALMQQAGLIREVLADAPPGPRYLIELTSGSRGAIASVLAEGAEMLDAVQGESRVGFCLDTCHMHAAGYDLATASGVHEMLDEVESTIGLGRLAVIHTNDSRDPRGSRRDRHWHLGEGQIGIDGFAALGADPRLSAIPFICETPGQVEDDRRNVELMRGLRRTAPVS